jgi:hypothetical protein
VDPGPDVGEGRPILESTDDDTVEPPSTPRRLTARHRLRGLSNVAFIAFLLICAARVLAVDIGGIVNNDALTYLREAESPLVDGLLFQGYRQVGYSLFMALSNGFGDLFGWDHVFGVALAQRGILVLGLALLAWSLRWWSAPVLIFATSASFVMQADFILIEGLLIPLCLIIGGLLAMVTVERVRSKGMARGVVIAACVLAALCAALKLQYAALLAPAAVIGWLLHRDGLITRRLALVALASSSLFVGVLAAAQSFENHSELGVFEPVAERHRSKWWGAWQAVFVHRPENVDDPALAEFYDDGNLYTFLHGVEREVPDYQQRKEIIERRTEAMLEAAGLSPRSEQVAALIGALRGGRSDDLAGVIDRTLAADPGDSMIRLAPNAVYQDAGPEVVADRYNDGLRPGIMTTGPVFDFSQRAVDHYGAWRSRASLLALVAMVASLFVRGRHRPGAIAVLATMLAVALAMASGYTDNARYLLGPLSIALVGGTMAVRALALSPAARAAWDRVIRALSGRTKGATPRISARRALDHQ